MPPSVLKYQANLLHQWGVLRTPNADQKDVPGTPHPSVGNPWTPYSDNKVSQETLFCQWGIPWTPPSILRISWEITFSQGAIPEHLKCLQIIAEFPSVRRESTGRNILPSECPRKSHSVSWESRGHQILTRECPEKSHSVSGKSHRYHILTTKYSGNPLLSVGIPRTPPSALCNPGKSPSVGGKSPGPRLLS